MKDTQLSLVQLPYFVPAVLCFQGQKWVNWGRDCKEGMTIKSVSGLKRYSRGTNEGNAMEVTVITNQNEVRMVKLIWERTSR